MKKAEAIQYLKAQLKTAKHTKMTFAYRLGRVDALSYAIGVIEQIDEI